MPPLSQKAQDVLARALKLPRAKRAQLTRSLLDSLDPSDPGVDPVWLEEMRARLDAFESRQREGLSAEGTAREPREERGRPG